jgi:hypothetical protein
MVSRKQRPDEEARGYQRKVEGLLDDGGQHTRLVPLVLAK